MYTMIEKAVLATGTKMDRFYGELANNIIHVSDGNLFYGHHHALRNISMEIKKKQ